MSELEAVILRKEKCVIFSNFLGFLDLLETDFHRNGIKFTGIRGSHTLAHRGKAVSDFMDQESGVTV